jgi:D-glycero-alpha-D-manno-heptose-7-phosphate kinase
LIITQTPLRISFFGGGTDFAEFYRQEEGCVLSSAIDKYIFVIAKKRYDQMIRVGYTQTELVTSLHELRHELVREACQMTGVEKQIEINTLGDIPSEGSGLGSSSTVTVGVLNALYHYINDPRPLREIAERACQIEIERLKKPIGKQDQYISSYGGLHFIRFMPDEKVIVERVKINYDGRRRLNQHLMLFYTNRPRRAESVLKEQRENISMNMTALRELKGMAILARELLESGKFDEFGKLLHEAWIVKKSLASKISNPEIDAIYEKARTAGALGGKITGAGGGGFLLLYCPREKQDDVRSALDGLEELPFHLEQDPTKVIFNYRGLE